MVFTSVNQWLDWQSQLHGQAIDLGLERIVNVFQRLNQQSSLAKKIITVAGTNGKGSVVAFLEGLLDSAGYRVGSYTSPHLLLYNERIKLFGQPVSDEQLCQAFASVELARCDERLTYFEFGTLAAFAIFEQHSLDIVILEVGLGGRLDAVNIVDADISIITSIALDHMDWLGHTRALIAKEKFGIARRERALILADAVPLENVDQLVAESGAICYRAGVDYRAVSSDRDWCWQFLQQSISALPLPNLRGKFQLDNAATALTALTLLGDEFFLTTGEVRRGLLNVTLPGRFEVLPGPPKQVWDVAHNAQAVQALAADVDLLNVTGDIYVLFSALSDKQIPQLLLPFLEKTKYWYLADLSISRGSKATKIRQYLHDFSVSSDTIFCFSTVHQAYQAVLAQLGDNDCLVAYGSFYVVAAVSRLPKVSVYER